MNKIIRGLIHLYGIGAILWLVVPLLVSTNDSLSDPTTAIIHYTGSVALTFVFILFSYRLIIRFFKEYSLLVVHRTLGLWTIFWVVMHIIAYLGLKLAWKFKMFVSEVISHFSLAIGMIASLIFIIAVIVMIPVIKKRIKKTWFPVHKWVTLSLFLITIHQFIVVKGITFYSTGYLILGMFLVIAQLYIKGWLNFSKMFLKKVN